MDTAQNTPCPWSWDLSTLMHGSCASEGPPLMFHQRGNTCNGLQNALMEGTLHVLRKQPAARDSSYWCQETRPQPSTGFLSYGHWDIHLLHRFVRDWLCRPSPCCHCHQSWQQRQSQPAEDPLNKHEWGAPNCIFAHLGQTIAIATSPRTLLLVTICSL